MSAPSSRDSYSPKEWMHELPITNLTYTYNPFSAPWGRSAWKVNHRVKKFANKSVMVTGNQELEDKWEELFNQLYL